jgi:hypothetical protein
MMWKQFVGCSTLPGESTPAAAAGDSISSTSGNSVAGGPSTVRGELGAQAEVSVIAGTTLESAPSSQVGRGGNSHSPRKSD